MAKLANFLAEKLEKNDKRLRKRLEVYIKDPTNQASVHDVRTAFRRFDASFSLMPKKARRVNSEYVEKCRQFFRATSKIRDCDVMRDRLAALDVESMPDALKEIEERRSAELGRSIRLARSLAGERPWRVRASWRQKSKAEARVEKVVSKLLGAIAKTMPAVVADPSKVEELHDLRKDCKKLRYVLEALPTGYRKRHEKELSRALAKFAGINKATRNEDGIIGVMEKLQDLLGAVHDSDITIEYLGGIDSGSIGRALDSEKKNRETLHQEFVQYVNG